MTGYLRVDSDGMRRGADQLESIGDRVARLQEWLRTATAAYDGCWGDDKGGTAFAATYRPARDGIIDGVGSVTEAYAGTGEGIRNWAQGYEATEDANVDIAKSLVAEDTPAAPPPPPPVGPAELALLPSTADVPRAETAATQRLFGAAPEPGTAPRH